MFGRETIIALRARRQAHRIATDILLPRLRLPRQPLVISVDESEDEYEWPGRVRRKSESPTWAWVLVYTSLLFVFVSLLLLITAILNSFLIDK